MFTIQYWNVYRSTSRENLPLCPILSIWSCRKWKRTWEYGDFVVPDYHVSRLRRYYVSSSFAGLIICTVRASEWSRTMLMKRKAINSSLRRLCTRRDPLFNFFMLVHELWDVFTQVQEWRARVTMFPFNLFRDNFALVNARQFYSSREDTSDSKGLNPRFTFRSLSIFADHTAQKLLP